MAKYTFSLDSYEIKDTRARHEDTNYVSVALSVNDTQVGKPLTKFMGNQNNGTYDVGLAFQDVEVPDGSRVVMIYNILNKGHGKQDEITQAMTDASQQQMDDASSGEGDKSFWDYVWDWTKKLAFEWVNADCDGPITPEKGRRIEWTSDELKGIPQGTKSEEQMDEPGSDSAWGCGSNSHYVVHFSETPVLERRVDVSGRTDVIGPTGGVVRDHRRTR